MTREPSGDDKGNARREELRAVVFALNDAFCERVQGLVGAEKRIVRLLVGKKISLNPKLVAAHMLASRTPVRSLKLDIRLHQRSILYFKSRRRSLEPALEAVGLSLAELDAEWEERVSAERLAHAAAAPAGQEEQAEEDFVGEASTPGAGEMVLGSDASSSLTAEGVESENSEDSEDSEEREEREGSEEENSEDAAGSEGSDGDLSSVDDLLAG